MSVSIDIVPSHHSLDMYGSPNPNSAYSLSGHVSISLTSTRLSSRKTVRLLLQSLTLIFEGQSELVSPFTGYVPLRLCTLKRDLAPEEPFELTNEGHEGDRVPLRWDVVFDLAIPGWLPATSVFGDADAGTRYSLQASAQFLNVDEGCCGRVPFLSSFCSVFRSKTRTVSAHRREVILKRYAVPPRTPPSPKNVFPDLTFHIENKEAAPGSLDISTKIAMVAKVPECVSIDDGSVPLSLHLRTNGLDEEERKRIRVTEFLIEIEQREEYRTRPSSSYVSRYPLPPHTNQPPNVPLLAPNSVDAIYEIGWVTPGPLVSKSTRLISLQPSKETGRYFVEGDPHIFADEANEEERSWYTFDANVPFVKVGCEKVPAAKRWGGPAVLRVTSKSPLLDVSHCMSFSVTCTYDAPGTDSQKNGRVTEHMKFTIPLRFVELAPTSLPPSPSLSASSNSSSDPLRLPEMTASTRNIRPKRNLPQASALPPYSHLFESDGQRRFDPLPLYEPPSKSAASSVPDLDLDTSQES